MVPVLKTLLFKEMIALSRHKVWIAEGANTLVSINARLQSYCGKVCVWSYTRLVLLVKYHSSTLIFSIQCADISNIWIKLSFRFIWPDTFRGRKYLIRFKRLGELTCSLYLHHRLRKSPPQNRKNQKFNLYRANINYQLTFKLKSRILATQKKLA